MKILLKTMFVILFLILLSSETYAINLGGVAKNNFAEISNSESTKFKMLFWNIENESYKVKLSIKETPRNWTIIIDPDEFVLNKSIGEEYIKLPYTDDNIRAKVVNLFVKPDENSKPDKYFIYVKAETEIKQNEENVIIIIPERIFKFEIDLKGFNITEPNKTTESKEKTVGFSGNGFDDKSENLKISNTKNENQINIGYIYYILIFMIIVISIIIYKK